LENTRFHNGEEAGDVEFARQLAVGFDIYVNDAFGAAHRSHASVDQVAKNMSVCVPGFVMERELQFLQVQTIKPSMFYQDRPCFPRASCRRD
jgi:phosphoglycerate kinase